MLLFRQLLVVFLVAILGGFSGYAAAAGGLGPAARTLASIPALSKLDAPTESVSHGHPVLESMFRLFGRLIVWQGVLGEQLTLDKPRIVINHDIIIGQLLGGEVRGDGDPNEADAFPAIGPAAGAPLGPAAVEESGNDETAPPPTVSWDPVVYEVKRGDSLSAIARRFGLSTDTLIDVNALRNPDMLRAGQILVIPPVDGRFYEVQEGDVLWVISDRFDVNIGLIIDANAMDDPSVLHVGQVLFIPGADQEVEPAAVAAATTTTQTLRWPLPVRGRVSSPFGPRMGTMHTGVDLAVPSGTAILAAASGWVTSARWLGAYGRAVVISHPSSGWKTLYAHASKLAVTEGDWVEQGQTIAYVGTSGRSTGPHLHFEVIINGHPRDPLLYVKRL